MNGLNFFWLKSFNHVYIVLRMIRVFVVKFWVKMYKTGEEPHAYSHKDCHKGSTLRLIAVSHLVSKPYAVYKVENLCVSYHRMLRAKRLVAGPSEKVRTETVGPSISVGPSAIAPPITPSFTSPRFWKWYNRFRTKRLGQINGGVVSPRALGFYRGGAANDKFRWLEQPTMHKGADILGAHPRSSFKLWGWSEWVGYSKLSYSIQALRWALPP